MDMCTQCRGEGREAESLRLARPSLGPSQSLYSRAVGNISFGSRNGGLR